MSKPEEKKAESAPMAPLAPPPLAPGKLPPDQHKRRWGGVEYPSHSFVKVTFLVKGSIGGERWHEGLTTDVPKSVFERTLKPLKQAKLYAAPKKTAKAARPQTDVGGFRRR